MKRLTIQMAREDRLVEPEVSTRFVPVDDPCRLDLVKEPEFGAWIEKLTNGYWGYQVATGPCRIHLFDSYVDTWYLYDLDLNLVVLYENAFLVIGAASSKDYVAVHGNLCFDDVCAEIYSGAVCKHDGEFVCGTQTYEIQQSSIGGAAICENTWALSNYYNWAAYDFDGNMIGEYYVDYLGGGNEAPDDNVIYQGDGDTYWWSNGRWSEWDFMHQNHLGEMVDVFKTPGYDPGGEEWRLQYSKWQYAECICAGHGIVAAIYRLEDWGDFDERLWWLVVKRIDDGELLYAEPIPYYEGEDHSGGYSALFNIQIDEHYIYVSDSGFAPVGWDEYPFYDYIGKIWCFDKQTFELVAEFQGLKEHEGSSGFIHTLGWDLAVGCGYLVAGTYLSGYRPAGLYYVPGCSLPPPREITRTIAGKGSPRKRMQIRLERRD